MNGSSMHHSGQVASATVLVVDDTPENIDVLRGVLKGHYKVKVAINGEQALKLCFSDQPPDLVLLDVMMPGMDGYEVCRRLKAEPRTEGLPVIFVTAMDDVRDEVKGFEVGGVDYISKPVTPAIVLARVRTHLQLRAAYRFIRDTFGRYLSDEIVDCLIDSPEGLKLGGEKRHLTVMMADLRGFTSIGERLPAESVVRMINIFLGRMTEVIQQYQGTIDEFIGDAILAIFGAPILRDDDALRAVRCAVAMQQAMKKVNQQFTAEGFPNVEMGIGINTGEVIVGNIGSSRRSKYGVVGRVVNTTSRIESYTIGGQILIAESTKAECGDLLRIDGQMQVMPKGLSRSITIYDVGGVRGDEPVELPAQQAETHAQLQPPVPVTIMPLTGRAVAERFRGAITAVGERRLEMTAEQPCSDFTNLRLLLDQPQPAIDAEVGELYVKVIGQLGSDPVLFQAYITSMTPRSEALLATLREQHRASAAQPVRLLHISDFHLFTDPRSQIKGLCSNDSLQAVLAHARTRFADPDLVILGGDLAQDEQVSTYQRLAGLLADWQAPFMVTPGNHANYSALRQTLIPALESISSYVEHLDLGGWRVIALNSHEQGSIGGLLAESELARLEQLLAASRDSHVLIALHHHPVPIGSSWLDAIALQNPDALWAVIDRHPQVRAVICGHIHQAFDAMRGSVRVLGSPSTCVQFQPRQDQFRLDGVSPGYRWLELLPDGAMRTGVERVDGFIPADLENDDPY